MRASHEVLIVYVNHRGEEGERRIIPREVFFGETEWHPGEQWFLRALDVGKAKFRTFAMKDIKSWRAAP
jgi:predicted DNA-binding transcriptional regulator YafY